MTTERKCPDCGCCCDYSSPCCNLKGGNADHPGGCKKITSGNLYISVSAGVLSGRSFSPHLETDSVCNDRPGSRQIQ